MSKADTPTENTTDDLSELSNEELLERVAALDEDEFPIATHAKRALADQEESA